MYCLAQGRTSVSALATSARQIHASATLAAPRSPLEKLGNVVIPSREEFLKKTGKGYVPDLTYLKNAPETSLASKLLRSATGESEIPPAAHPTPAKPALTKEKLQELIDKRRKERFERSIGPLQNQINVNATKLQAAASLSRETIFKAGVSTLPAKEYQRVAKSTDRLRKERNSRNPSDQQPHRGKQATKQGAAGAKPTQRQPRAVEPEADDSIDLSDMDGPVDYNYEEFPEEGSCMPTFSGPQPVSSTLCEVLAPGQGSSVLSTPTGEFPIPQHLVSSFIKRKYSDYVPVSDKDFAQTPKQLGASKVAQVSLSHNVHYPLPQRQHTMRIIKSAVATNARDRVAPSS